MRKSLPCLVVRAIMMMVGGSGLCASAKAEQAKASFAGVNGAAQTPYGWADFCGRHRDQCNGKKLEAVMIPLDVAKLNTLIRINESANSSITPVSNFEHWGTMLDHWDYPTDGKGDCKVFALYKRKLLLAAGFPRQALLMTIAKLNGGESHTVLMVRTDRGDLILDNIHSDIRPWDKTGYQFIKRQDQSDPNLWLSMSGTGNTAAN